MDNSSLATPFRASTRTLGKMITINRTAEFNRLLLTWQPKSGGTRYVVGQMEGSQETGYTFEYLPEQSDFVVAQDKGFVGFPAFDCRTRLHQNNVLDPFIRRLPPKSRGDFKTYLKSHLLPDDFTETYSLFSLLAYTGAKSPGDGFCLVPDLSTAEPREFDFILEVAGTRYCKGLDLDQVTLGDSVKLCPEPNNHVDPQAIAVIHHTDKLGYVNRVLCPFVHRKLESGHIQAKIAKKNGTVDRPLLYLIVSVTG